MLKRLRKSRGFTLIELLIVIAIIGILTTILLINLQGVRERARDARRKSDLDAIKNALQLYYNDAQRFPTSDTQRIVGCGTIGSPSVCDWGNPFATNETTYMTSLPYDPNATSDPPPYDLRYRYYNFDSDSYILLAVLENASDSDAAESQNRCQTAYTQFSGIGGTVTAKDYVLCSE